MKELEKHPESEVLYYLNINWDRAKVDYGALYFFINVYKILLNNGFYDSSLFEKVDFLLSDSWPEYMKFKSSAMQVLACLSNTKFSNYLEKFSDKRYSSFWKNRYTILLILQNREIHINNKLVKLFLNDSHRFVRLKAKELFL